MILLGFILAAASSSGGGSIATVAAIVGVISAGVTALTAFLSVKANRKNAQAANTTAEGNAIKAITEANSMALKNLRDEIDRLTSHINEVEQNLHVVKDRLQQERQWTVRLIRALNQAGVDIPQRPEHHPNMTELDTDEIAAVINDQR